MTTSKKTVPRLRLVDDAKHALIEPSSSATDLLGELVTEVILRRVGHEVRVSRRPAGNRVIDVTRCDSQLVVGGGHVAVGRYLLRERDPGGRILGALVYTVQSKASGRQLAVVTHVVVDPAARRQGVATKLLEEFTEDHPGARVVSTMTPDGAAFFGYAAAAGAMAASVVPAGRRV